MMKTVGVAIQSANQLHGPLESVFRQWNDLRAGKTAPTWSEFSLVNLPPKSLPWTVVVEPVPDHDDFRIRFWGTERSRLQGEQTGNLVSSLSPPELAEKLLSEYREVRDAQSPMLYATDATNDRVSIHFTMMRLPISDDGRSVTRILSMIDYNRIDGSLYDFYDTTRPYHLRT